MSDENTEMYATRKEYRRGRETKGIKETTKEANE
jgi:hypothetical protein